MLVLGISATGLAQEAEVSGRVETLTGHPVEAAVVSMRGSTPDLPARLVSSDSLGRFRISRLPPGTYTLSAQRLGYGQVSHDVTLAADQQVSKTLVLPEAPHHLEGITVHAERRRRLARATGLSSQLLEASQLELLPGFAETDLLRALETLPGVVSISDYSTSYHVRGGSADQNLILIDGFPIYNPFHLGGLFSVFNSDMISRAELLAGGFPAAYGGRVSSVLEVESDPGGKGLEVDAGLSLLASRAAIGADLPSGLTQALGLESARLRGSVRRSYFDAILKPFFDFPYHLLDYQAVFEAWTPSGGRWNATAYHGRDVLDLAHLAEGTLPLRLRWHWGNSLAGLRHVRPLSHHSRFLDIRAGYTQFSTAVSFPEFEDMRLGGEIQHALVRADLHTTQRPHSQQSYGLEVDLISHTNRAEAAGSDFGSSSNRALLASVYSQTANRLSNNWLLEAGGRAELFFPEDDKGVIELSPRVALKRLIRDGTAAFKLATGRYTQYVQSIRDEDIPVGIDIWMVAGEQVPHIISDQVQAGVETEIGDLLSASVEGYYRRFDGVGTWNHSADPNIPGDLLITGHGRSWGADMLIRRESAEAVNGWLAVSWLKALHTFADEPNAANQTTEIVYPPGFDRRLNIDLVVRTHLPGQWNAGLRWTYGSGLPYTRPLGSYTFYDPQPGSGKRLIRHIQGSAVEAVVLGPRNAERYPPYHRLDAGLRRTFKTSWGTIIPNINIVNIYNRRNVLFYLYHYDRDPPVRSGISMFPFLPTIGFQVHF